VEVKSTVVVNPVVDVMQYWLSGTVPVLMEYVILLAVVPGER